MSEAIIKKNGIDYPLLTMPNHYPADRVYLDGNTTKNVQDKCARKADLANLDLTGTINTTGSTISSGTYFYLNGTLVRAKTDIASGATFTLNTNYEVVTVGDELSGLIKKKSYTFSSFTENCMVTDLNTTSSIIIGFNPIDRNGWNLIARHGVTGNLFSDRWVITEASNKALSGTYNIEVFYINKS